MITIIIIIIGNINSYYNNNKLRYHMKSAASQILNDSLSLCYTIFQLIITICFFNVLRFHLDVTSSHLILARPWWERVLTQNSYSVSIATITSMWCWSMFPSIIFSFSSKIIKNIKIIYNVNYIYV